MAEFSQLLLLSSSLVLTTPVQSVAETNSMESILDATGCTVVLNQTTQSCKTTWHDICDGGKTAAVDFDAKGNWEFSRVLIEGVNQTTFQSTADGLIFVRTGTNDDVVDFDLVQNGQTDSFHFTFRDIFSIGISITVSGIVRRSPKFTMISNQQVSYLNWDWTYIVDTPNGSYTSEIETVTEFYATLGL